MFPQPLPGTQISPGPLGSHSFLSPSQNPAHPSPAPLGPLGGCARPTLHAGAQACCPCSRPGWMHYPSGWRFHLDMVGRWDRGRGLEGTGSVRLSAQRSQGPRRGHSSTLHPPREGNSSGSRQPLPWSLARTGHLCSFPREITEMCLGTHCCSFQSCP